MLIQEYLLKTKKLLTEDFNDDEKDKKSKTDLKDKAKDKSKIDLKTPTSLGSLETIKPVNQSPSEVGKKLSKDEIKNKLGKVNAPTGSSNIVSQFMDRTRGITDTIPNQDTANTVGTPTDPIEVTPRTLPDIIKKSLTAKDDKNVQRKVNINWMQVKDLPGYAVQQIRGAFRPLFDSIMGCNLEDINVVTDLGGMSNSVDLRQLIGYISKYGVKDDNFSLEAFDIDPEAYHIENAFVYNWDGVAYLILKENLMGKTHYYVYSGAGRGTKIGSDKFKELN